MTLVYNYATLNAQCLRSRCKQTMLRDFVMNNDIDVLMLQEVNIADFSFLGPQYDFIANPGEQQLGTAIVYRSGMTTKLQETHPSGRLTAINLNDTHFINVYLPSGSNKRHEREHFINTQLPFFFRHRYHRLIIGGDFNCVLSAKDQKGTYNPSPALQHLVQDLPLVDSWELLNGTHVEFTFCRNNSASRIDRIYINNTYKDDVRRVKVIPITFSDHDSLKVTVTAPTRIPIYGRSYWKLNEQLLNLPEICDRFQENWKQLALRAARSNLSIIHKWMNVIKPGIRNLFKYEGIMKAKERRNTLEFYNQVLIELYDSQREGNDRINEIQVIKQHIYKLNEQYLQGAVIRAYIPSVTEEEKCTIYHVVKEKQNGQRKYISQLKTDEGTVLKTTTECVKEAEKVYKNIYEKTEVSETAITNLLQYVKNHVSKEEQNRLIQPIKEEELQKTRENILHPDQMESRMAFTNNFGNILKNHSWQF